MENKPKNYGIGRHVSLWWNDGTEGKAGYYTVQIRRQYTDKMGVKVEEKMSMFGSDAVQILMELQRAVQIVNHPRELVRREQPADMPAEPGDDIPF